MRESNGGIKQKTDSRGFPSWLHRLDPNAPAAQTVKLAKAPDETPKLSRAELDTMAKQFRTNLSQRRLDTLSRELGVTNDALKAYDVGWRDKSETYTFPMRVGAGRQIVGFRTRTLDGKHKACVPGSREGLFIPSTYDPSPLTPEDDACPVLLLPEGPTDAAAAWDSGYTNAVGRPSNRGGANHIRHLIGSQAKCDVIIFADHDETKYLPDWRPFWPGYEGALSLAEQIVDQCPKLWLIEANDLFAAKDQVGKRDVRNFISLYGAKELPKAIARAAVRIDRKSLSALLDALKAYTREVWERKKAEMSPPSLPALVELVEWSRISPLAMVA